MNPIAFVRNVRHAIKQEGAGRALYALLHRFQSRLLEWRYGIQTEATIELAELNIHNEECKYYSPTGYFDFREIIRALEIDPREHVFLDYGAGMGRAMILAAMYPFRRVLGVEIAPDLIQIARDNISSCRAKLRCQDIEITACDATLYRIPADVSVFYFNNPFFGSVLSTVLNKVRTFSNSLTRSVFIVCNVPSESAFEKQVLEQGWLSKKKEIALEANRHCLIFSPVIPGSDVAAN